MLPKPFGVGLQRPEPRLDLIAASKHAFKLMLLAGVVHQGYRDSADGSNHGSDGGADDRQNAAVGMLMLFKIALSPGALTGKAFVNVGLLGRVHGIMAPAASKMTGPYPAVPNIPGSDGAPLLDQPA